MTVLWLFWQILIQYCKFLMPRCLKRGIIGASTIILSKDINKYAFMCGSNFYESDVIAKLFKWAKKNTRIEFSSMHVPQLSLSQMHWSSLNKSAQSVRNKQREWKKKCMRTWYQYRQTSHSIFVSPGFDWLSFFSLSFYYAS